MPNTLVRGTAEGSPSIHRPRTASAAALLLPPAAGAETIRLGEGALIEIGKELDRLIAEWRPLHAIMEREHNRWSEELARRGLSLDRESDYDECWRLNEEMGVKAASEADERATGKIDATCKVIREIQPRTLAGLAVWAKATRFDCLSVEAQEMPLNDTDWDDECLIRFLAEVERMAGGGSA